MGKLSLLWGAAKLFLQRNALILIVSAFSVYSVGVYWYGWDSGREGLREALAADRAKVLEDRLQIEERERALDRELAQRTERTMNDLANQRKRAEEAFDEYVRENPNLGCSISSDDELRLVRELWGLQEE